MADTRDVPVIEPTMTDPEVRTPLSDLLDEITQASGARVEIEIPADWLQGRAIYGGLSAALCLHTAQTGGAELPPLRSAQLAFMAPAGPGVALVPSILRRGKSTCFVGVDMQHDDGAIAARATFCFGAARHSALDYEAVATPNVPDADDAPAFFEDASGNHHGPNFARHFDSRHAAGAWPMSGAETPEFTAWMRHRDRRLGDSVVALAALADALPPAAMACFKEAAPVSSMTWQFDLLDPTPSTDDGWWLCRSEAQAIAGGYSPQRMTIWNRAGKPILVGRQTVAVFY